jgi:hypothetical protein
MKGTGPPKNPSPNDAPKAPPRTDNNNDATKIKRMIKIFGLANNFPNSYTTLNK